MATHRLNLSDFSGTDYGYVDMTMTPEPGEPIFPGDTVTISGTVLCRKFAVKQISIQVPCFQGSSESSVDYEEIIVKKSINKGASGKFTHSFVIPPAYFTGLTNRFYTLIEDKTANFGMTVSSSSDNLYCIGMPNMVYAKYRLMPSIDELKFRRVRKSGSSYINDDGGNYIRCESMKLGKNSSDGAVNSDFSIIRFSYGVMGGSKTTKTLTYTDSKFTTAMGSGYKESNAPVLFTGEFSPTDTYEITLTLGDQYNQASATVTIPRAFANLHLSGAPQGGVAIGQYSSVDPNDPDDPPKFEVAPGFKSHLYGGADIPGINSYQPGEVATGGHWINGKPIYRCVLTGSVTLKSSNSAYDLCALPSNPETMISLNGFYHNSTNIRFMNSAHINPDVGIFMILFDRSTRMFRVTCGTSVADTYTYVIIAEYTKADATADPGSPGAPEIADSPADPPEVI